MLAIGKTLNIVISIQITGNVSTRKKLVFTADSSTKVHQCVARGWLARDTNVCIPIQTQEEEGTLF